MALPQHLQRLAIILDAQQQQDDELAVALLVLRRRRRRERRFWVRPWILRRQLFGQYETLMAELELESHGDFRGFMRMEPGMFHELLTRLTPRLTKVDTNFRKALEPGLKLAITLRFLASGANYRSLAFAFRVPHNTIGTFVGDVCEAIIAELSHEVVRFPVDPQGWRDVSEKFLTRWNFPNTVGAIDGKHIAMKAPKESGTLYHNYKGFFSLILLAVVDADYRFLWVDVGANGSTSDCAVFNQTPMKAALEADELGFPRPTALPGDDTPVPYYLIGDDAFPLRTWMMKPFSTRNLSDEERIFNYRLSRARRVVENAFGILSNRFRCLLTTLHLCPMTVRSVVLATVCLHNLMRMRYPGLQNALVDAEDEDHNLVPGQWRNQEVMHDMAEVVAATADHRLGKTQRVLLKHYLNSQAGAVPWQREML